MDGVLRCSRYSFGPNRLHYCGPDKNSQMKSYIDGSESDPDLSHLLKQFETLYPYLKYIARTNGITDPFNEKVVEAYWLGNELLETSEKRRFYDHLVEDHKLKKKMSPKAFSFFENKIGQGAVPHHSFHVFNVWKRTGYAEEQHSLESMDECRVSWGRVVEASGPNITVLTEPILYVDKKLFLGEPVEKKLTRRLEAEYDIEQIVPGNIVSIHWSVPCEVITERQAENLKRYTLRSLELANQTL